MKRVLFLILGALAAAALACNLPTQAESTSLPPTEASSSISQPAESPTATPDTAEDVASDATATISPVVAVPGGEQSTVEAAEPTYGDAIYETRFLSGWPEINTERGSSRVVDGVYRVEVGPDWAHWVFTTQAIPSEFYAEVVATPETCPANGASYGIIFQYEDSNTFRFFVATCDNQYVLGERAGTRNRAIESGPLPGDSNMAQDEHKVSVWVRGSTISGYVDGQFAGSATFDTMPTGDIGPYVETGEEAAVVSFSRLAIYESGQ